MLRNFQYRLYPNKAQVTALDDMLHAYRSLYNAALQERRDAWRRRGASVRYAEQCAQLKDIRAGGDPLNQYNFTAAQQVLRRLDKAFDAFFRRIKSGQKAGYPRFKSASRFRSVPFRFGDGATLRSDRLNIQGVGQVKVKWHRPIPPGAVIKLATVQRDGDEWYVSFQLELSETEKPVHAGPPVGIDLGLSSLVTLSTGEKVEPPHYFRRAEAKLARQQRRLAGRKRGSKRQDKARKQVAKTHQKIRNQRKDFAHKLSRRLANEFSLIAFEDLNVSGMVRSSFAKSILDAGWGQVLTFTDYKAEEAGGLVTRENPYRSSQECNGCGCIVPKDLSVRVHVCPQCGLIIDRDENAALNILDRALIRLGRSRQALAA